MDRMDTVTAYEVHKLRTAERHQEAARARLVTGARSIASDDERRIPVWRRWTVRKLVGRITLAKGQA